MDAHIPRPRHHKPVIIRRIYWIIFLLISPPALASSLTCPSSIETTQTLTHSMPEWLSQQYLLPHPLLAYQLYDGPPEEMAILKPDNGDSNQPISTWTLPAQKLRDYWVICQYTNTSVYLARKLPHDAYRCHYTHATPTHPEIGSLICTEKRFN